MRKMNGIKFYYFLSQVRMFIQKHILRKQIGRQRYLIETLPLNAYIPDVIFYNLLRRGFQPNYFAYHDSSELYNLRRLKMVEDEIWQEHVRIFPDEVRAHYEISYEEDAEAHVDGKTIMEVSELTRTEILAGIPRLK